MSLTAIMDKMTEEVSAEDKIYYFFSIQNIYSIIKGDYMAITVKDMRIIELNTVSLGIPLIRLMEAAGKSVAEAIISRLKPGEAGRIVVLMGRGGNGGDGIVAARYLDSFGYNVEILPAYREELINHPDTLENYSIVKRLTTIKIHRPGRLDVLDGAGVIIDGLLGTGVKGELRDPIKSIVEKANKVNTKLKVAIDTPTGLNPDTGDIHGIAFKADITVTFHDLKPGLLKRKDIAGEIIVADIGVPRDATIYVGPGDIVYNVPDRPKDAHKGSSGRILVIGGSNKYTGAPALAGLAALAAGSDLAFIACPESIRDIIAGYSPELITIPYPGKYLSIESLDHILKTIEEYRPHVIIVGPGLGRRPETLEAVRRLLDKLVEENKRIVIDADALKAIDYDRMKFKGKAVLTPHRGEFKSITGKTVEQGQEGAETVAEAARRLEATILLKAPIDIISDGERLKYNRTGNPYMAIGGTGDVLTGIVASMYALTGDPFVSASIAAYINGLAGDYLLKNGEKVSPTNIIKVIDKVIKDPLNIHINTYT